MDFNPAPLTPPSSSLDRVLLVADWTVDPQAVVTAARSLRAVAGLGLLVPARLHGLDWVGDPSASFPCARRQLEAINQLASEAGLTIASAGVGDPDPLAAISDALADWPADRLLLCARQGRNAPYPFDLASRARRLTGLAVERVGLPAAATPQTHRRRLRLGAGHCPIEQPQAA